MQTRHFGAPDSFVRRQLHLVRGRLFGAALFFSQKLADARFCGVS